MRCHLPLLLLPLLLAPLPTGAEELANLPRIRAMLQAGNPDGAIESSRKRLQLPNLAASERLDLLELIADAEKTRVAAKGFEKIEPAVKAYEELLRLSPSHPRAAYFQLQIATLYYRNDNDAQAERSCRALLARHGQSPETRDGWLLLARLQIRHSRLNEARAALIQYGVRTPSGTLEQAVGYGWLAWIDAQQGNTRQALTAFDQLVQQQPNLLDDDARLRATYIDLLLAAGRDASARQEIRRFLDRQIESDQAPRVRLAQGALLEKQQRWLDAEQAYAVVAAATPDLAFGKQAAMRRLMVQVRNDNTAAALRAPLATLARIANSNQLSQVESEALTHQTALWLRIGDTAALTQAITIARHAAQGVANEWRERARNIGRQALIRRLDQLLDARDWSAAVALWQENDELHPPAAEESALQLRMAQSFRHAGRLAEAEVLLADTAKLGGSSLIGQKALVEQARIWLARGDGDAIARLQALLGKSKSSLYGPEMLLILAQMQEQQGDPASGKSLARIDVRELSPEDRADYWRLRARQSERAGNWREAAQSWQSYGQQSDADLPQARRGEADALFAAGLLAQAAVRYGAWPAPERDARWHFRMALCELASGKEEQGVNRLNQLSANAEAGVWRTQARLKLAEREADALQRSAQ